MMDFASSAFLVVGAVSATLGHDASIGSKSINQSRFGPRRHKAACESSFVLANGKPKILTFLECREVCVRDAAKNRVGESRVGHFVGLNLTELGDESF